MHNGLMKINDFSAIAKRAWWNLTACLRQCGALIVMLIVLLACPAEAYAVRFAYAGVVVSIASMIFAK